MSSWRQMLFCLRRKWETLFLTSGRASINCVILQVITVHCFCVRYVSTRIHVWPALGPHFGGNSGSGNFISAVQKKCVQGKFGLVTMQYQPCKSLKCYVARCSPEQGVNVF